MALRLSVDPWPPDYDSAVQIDETDAEARQVDVRVETAEWKAICCATVDSFPLVCFVDGVLRVEIRVISEAENQIIYGLFGSTGAGTVVCRNGLAEMGQLAVRRYLIIGLQKERTQPLRIGETNLQFEGIAVAVNDPLSPWQELQNLMRAAEVKIGESLLSDQACVFMDGPLTYFTTAKEALVGIVKTIHRRYLPGEYQALLGQLRAGERTPLFLIHDEKQRYDRYSCYLRLAEPQGKDHRLAGIVRLEVRAAVDMAKIVSLVNYASCELPRFASSPIRDPRAPQNLVPIGALEDELRRRLGDPLLIRRAIEEKISEGVLIE